MSAIELARIERLGGVAIRARLRALAARRRQALRERRVPAEDTPLSVAR